MCWSAEVSFQSFFIGITAIFFAYQKGLSFPTTLFSLTIVLMQLIEGIIWSYPQNKTVNFLGSLAAANLLWLQPIAAMFTLPKDYFLPLLQIYLALSLLSFLLMPLDSSEMKQKYSMERGPSGHLVWNWLQKDRKTALSLLVYFVFLLGPLVYAQEWLLLSFALLTLFGSLYHFHKDGSWGSMWCWFVNYIVVGICGYQILKN